MAGSSDEQQALLRDGATASDIHNSHCSKWPLSPSRRRAALSVSMPSQSSYRPHDESSRCRLHCTARPPSLKSPLDGCSKGLDPKALREERRDALSIQNFAVGPDATDAQLRNKSSALSPSFNA